MKNHNDVVDQYKTKLTQQFDKMKYQLETSRTENQELKKKIEMFEQKLQELNSKKVNKIDEFYEFSLKILLSFKGQWKQKIIKTNYCNFRKKV